MKYILAIDQGTTGSRAVVYDRRGKIVSSAYREFPQHFPRPGWVEHKASDLWDSVNYSIQKALKGLPPDSISAIGITNQRETTVMWDRRTGKSVHNAIVWQCRRTSARCDEIKRDKKFSALVKEKTGLPVDAYFSATKIEWMLKNVPGVLRRARSGEIAFGTPDSWILWNLTGGRAHATDYTNASRTMCFDINTLKWDEKILKRFGIPAAALPEVKRSSGIFGYTKNIGRLTSGIPVSGIAGDQQAALFGQACFEPGMIKNTYGTGCFMLMNAGRKKPVSKHGLITTIACGAGGEPVYALEGSVFIAGAAIQWLRDGLKIIKTAAGSEKAALSVADNGGVYFVPALVGLGAPYWDQEARGAIYGITRGTGRGHIARSAIEAICYQSKDVLLAMQKDSGIKIKALRVDGGAAGNDHLCRFQADVLGVDVVRPKVTEITSLGAAYLAGLSTGYWKNFREIRRCWTVDRVFRPRMPAAQSAKLYAGWLNAVGRTLTKGVRGQMTVPNSDCHY